jgi:hypothetical protein
MDERRKYLATEARKTIQAINNNDGYIYEKFKVKRCDETRYCGDIWMRILRTVDITIVNDVKITYKTKDLIIKKINELYEKFNKKYGKQYIVSFTIFTTNKNLNTIDLDKHLTDMCKKTYYLSNLSRITNIGVEIQRNEHEYQKKETARKLKKHIPINDLIDIIQNYHDGDHEEEWSGSDSDTCFSFSDSDDDAEIKYI